MAATETADAFDYEAAVAAFIAGFRLSDIDAEAMSAVKAILKDQLALQLSAADLSWSRDARRFFEKPRPGDATIAAEGTTMDAADAGYINATYGHGFEYDDVAANGHPGACVVPTAIAIGEETGATLGQMVEAMVAGYEPQPPILWPILFFNHLADKPLQYRTFSFGFKDIHRRSTDTGVPKAALAG